MRRAERARWNNPGGAIDPGHQQRERYARLRRHGERVLAKCLSGIRHGAVYAFRIYLTAGLSAGTYSGGIQITSSGASNTPLSVGVTLTVTQPPPSLSVAPQALSFSYTAGAAAPAAQSVSITNAGAGALSWTASTSDYWIAVSAASGSAPGTLSVSVNPANLAAATYTSSVQIAAAGATGSPASIAITLVVQGTQPAGNITAVSNAGSFQPSVASATWVSIFGTNLSAVTYTWQASDFVNGCCQLPCKAYRSPSMACPHISTISARLRSTYWRRRCYHRPGPGSGDRGAAGE